MLADRVRIEAYRRALASVIRPESVVLDVGAGAGILSLIACRLGAARVIAIEPADAIHVGRELAAANGCADRIEFIQGLSTGVTLPGRADVIVSDMRGVLPFHGRHLPAIADARARLLAPGGTLIPRQDVVWAAPVEAAALYATMVDPWRAAPDGLDFAPALRFATNRWTRGRFTRDQLLAAPREWVTIDYQAVDRAGAHREMRFEAGRSGTVHGFAAWFDADLCGGAGFSNAPGEPDVIYGHAFFPLSAPVAVDPGDTITLDLAADLVGDDYVWRWSTRVAASAPPHREKALYRQSTFWGAPLAAASLRKRAAGFVPCPTADAEVDAVILALMDGRAAAGDIARAIHARFPSRFATWEDALARVGTLSLEYSQ